MQENVFFYPIYCPVLDALYSCYPVVGKKLPPNTLYI